MSRIGRRATAMRAWLWPGNRVPPTPACLSASSGRTFLSTDPTEIVHDRERERYSKHISRTFPRGTYYLEVNANHPDYILRTRVLPVPPYDDPARAVEAGMHYIINVGDAWFAQIPREGNIYV